jgi:hypothetical protein
MANQSIYAAFERMWQHIVAIVGNKANIDHNHNDIYYTESESDNLFVSKADLNAITNDEIDEICGASVTPASEVEL